MKNKYILIKKSKIHGKGAFAKFNIKKGTYIIEYIGEIISKKEGNLRSKKQYYKSIKNKNLGSVYIFELDQKHDLDGFIPENIAKFINHSCNPNCIFKIIKKHIWRIAKRNIKKGEEITYDYGYDFDKYYKEHPCKCNGKGCLGYIVGKKYRKKLKKEMKI